KRLIHRLLDWQAARRPDLDRQCSGQGAAGRGLDHRRGPGAKRPRRSRRVSAERDTEAGPGGETGQDGWAMAYRVNGSRSTARTRKAHAHPKSRTAPPPSKVREPFKSNPEVHDNGNS